MAKIFNGCVKLKGYEESTFVTEEGNILSKEDYQKKQIELFGEEAFQWEYNPTTPDYVSKELYKTNINYDTNSVSMLQEINSSTINLNNYDKIKKKNKMNQNYGNFYVKNFTDENHKDKKRCYVIIFIGVKHWNNVTYKTNKFYEKKDEIHLEFNFKDLHKVKCVLQQVDKSNVYKINLDNSFICANMLIRKLRGRKQFEEHHMKYWNFINKNIDKEETSIVTEVNKDKDVDNINANEPTCCERNQICYFNNCPRKNINIERLRVKNEREKNRKNFFDNIATTEHKKNYLCKCDNKREFVENECRKCEDKILEETIDNTRDYLENFLTETTISREDEDLMNTLLVHMGVKYIDLDNESTTSTTDDNINVPDDNNNYINNENEDFEDKRTIDDKLQEYYDNEDTIYDCQYYDNTAIDFKHNCCNNLCTIKGCIGLNGEDLLYRLNMINRWQLINQNNMFCCSKCMIDINYCDCLRLNLCPFDYCDRYHNNTTTCVENKELDDIAGNHNDQTFGWGNTTIINEIESTIDNIENTNNQELKANEIREYFDNHTMYYSNNAIGNFMGFGRRRNRGKRREQDNYYSQKARQNNNNNSIKKKEATIIMNSELKDQDDEEQKYNKKITSADYLFHLLMNENWNRFDLLVESKYISHQDLSKLIYILNYYKVKEEERIRHNEIINWLKQVKIKKISNIDRGPNGLTNSLDVNIEIMTNTEAEESLARAWARLVHSYNGNIDTEFSINSIKKENIGPCAQDIITKLGEITSDNENIELYFDNNHVSEEEFLNCSKGTYKDLITRLLKGERFDNKDKDAKDKEEEQEKKEKEIQDKKEKEAKEEVNKAKREEKNEEKIKTPIGNSNLSSKWTKPESLKNMPIDGAVNEFFNIIYSQVNRERRVETWNACVYGTNFSNYKMLRRQELYYRYNNTSNISCTIPSLHPRLNTPNGDGNVTWTEWDIVDLPHSVFRIGINDQMIGNKLVVKKNFSDLYEKIDSGGDISYFRSFFGTNFQNVISKGVLQNWVLQTKNMSLNKTRDIRRWLVLFLRAQQQSDIIDKNVFLQTNDLEVLGTNTRPIKNRTVHFVDPINNANPKLFPFLTDNEVIRDGGGNRVLPIYTIKMSDFIKYIINGSSLGTNTLGAGFTIEQIISKKVAVVFVHPYMQHMRNSLTEHTIGHLSHPLFHWSQHLSARTVGAVDIANNNGLGAFNFGSWNQHYQDANGNILEYCNFESVIQANDVKVDGASQGILFVRTTDFETDILLFNNAAITMLQNYILAPGAGDMPLDITPVLQAYQQANIGTTPFLSTSNWIAKETGNMNDYIAAMALFANYSHVVGTPIIERINGYQHKFSVIGELATANPIPASWPDANVMVNQNLNQFIYNNNGVFDDNVGMGRTIESYKLLNNALGQRKRSYINTSEINIYFDTQIPDMDILERVALIIGTHDIEGKIKMDEYTTRSMFEIVVDGKNCAKAILKAADIIYQSTDIPMGELLMPMNNPTTTYSRLLYQNYHNGEHVQSKEIIDLFDIITNNALIDEDKLDRLFFSGQYSTLQIINNAIFYKQPLNSVKWIRDPQTIGFEDNDHIEFTEEVDINWNNKPESFFQVNNNAIRWRKDWKYKWNELELLEWTRLNYDVLNFVPIDGYSTLYKEFKNVVGKENQSWYTFARFMQECGINVFQQSIGPSDYILKPYGNKRLYYDETDKQQLQIGTWNSIAPWSQQAIGFILTSVGSNITNKYDINAPSLENNPSKSQTLRFL